MNVTRRVMLAATGTGTVIPNGAIADIGSADLGTRATDDEPGLYGADIFGAAVYTTFEESGDGGTGTNPPAPSYPGGGDETNGTDGPVAPGDGPVTSDPAENTTANTTPSTVPPVTEDGDGDSTPGFEPITAIVGTIGGVLLYDRLANDTEDD